MKIGIDLDGVVYNSEEEWRVYTELYDILVLKQNSKKNNEELLFQDRFDWPEESAQDFLEKYHEKLIKKANYMPGAIDVLNLLKKDGHELIMITARGRLNDNIVKITEDRLKQDGINIFDKYYYKTSDKEKVCLKEKVDLMIDDSYKKCQSIASVGIKTVYFKAAASHALEDNEYIKTLYNWGEIYRYIRELSKN